MADNSGLIVDALERTNPNLAASIDARNSWKTAIAKRGARVKLYRNYERGDHKADITKEMKKMLRIDTDNADLTDFNANYMRVVVDKFASRVFVSNIAIDDSAKDWLAETLARNNFDAEQSTWYRGAVRDGDSYVMVDSETLLWSSEPAYDGFNGIVAIHDGITKDIIWACKLWSESDTTDIAGDETSTNVIMKMVVCEPESVSFWLGTKGGTEVKPHLIEVDTNSKAVIIKQGNAIVWRLGRVHIIPFSNQLDNYTNHGESELRPGVPLQDVLNRTLHSMVMASEFAAFKLIWSIGFEIDVDGIVPGGVLNLVLKDDDGKIITDLDAEMIEFLKTAKVGQFEETDISQYTNQIDAIVRQISQATQTPIYGVTAQGNLSGEALKQLEIGLIGKIERFQHQNTDPIKELIQLTADMQNEFVNELGKAPVFEHVKVIWKSPELLDVNARIQTLLMIDEKSPGRFTSEFFIKRIGALLAMSQKDIDEEIEKSADQEGFLFEALSGGGGTIPVA